MSIKPNLRHSLSERNKNHILDRLEKKKDLDLLIFFGFL